MRKLIVAMFATAALTSALPSQEASAQSFNSQSSPTVFGGSDGWSSWLGTYAGAFAGASRLSSNDNAGIDGITSEAKHSAWGGMGGALIGYNFSASGLLLGVEADVSYLGGSSSALTSPVIYGAPGGVVSKVEADWMASLRARVGLPMGQFMPFVTGGISVADMTLSHSFPTYPGSGRSKSEMNTGWTVGGGLEVLVARGVSFRAEYLYTDFGSMHLTNNPDPGPAVPVFNQTARPTMDTIRAGLTFRF